MKVLRYKLAYMRGMQTQRKIILFSFVALFLTFFDSIMSYITPLVMEERGLSISMIGFVIGTSSISGALFDFFISKVFRSIDFRRIFLLMFAICAVYPLLLWHATSIWFFLFVMAIWGIYYDFYGFGIFNFIGRYNKKEDNATNFGIVETFKALGGILAPLIVGLLIATQVDWKAYTISWFVLGIGFVFFITLIITINRNPRKERNAVQTRVKKNLLLEVKLWKKLSGLMIPVLLITFYLFFVEAFFWTLAPLYAESAHLGHFGGLFLTAYSLPALGVGLIVSPITSRFGKKRTAIAGILFGSIIFSLFTFISNPIIAIFSVFIGSCFISIALPAVNAAYADYISEGPKVEGEIEAIEDFSFNSGYILGPILAGVFADLFSIPSAFTILGIIGIILAVFLWLTTPRYINVRYASPEL